MGPGGMLDNTRGHGMLGRNDSFNIEESINLNSSSFLDWDGNNKQNATMSVDESIGQSFI
jgi:hypothetical protein